MYSPLSHRPMPPLSRYGSAPGSLLKSLVDDSVDGDGGFSAATSAVVGSEGFLGRYSLGESAKPSCKPAYQVDDVKTTPRPPKTTAACSGLGLERMPSYGYDDPGMNDYKPELPSSLIRHSSTPAGFLNRFMLGSGGFPSMTRGLGSYNSRAGGGAREAYMNGSTLKPQLSSFSRQDSLSQLSDMSMPDFDCDGDHAILSRNGAGDRPTNGCSQSYNMGSGNLIRMGSWDDSNPVAFPSSPSKRSKDINGEIAAALNNVDSEFNMANKSVDMVTMEKFLQLQQDSVPCKVRAKRGCATHPRSIAERDRRTRISEKLRKLQELMPYMDKQTNTAEMLDLAVQYIKSLQSQLQELQQEQANCTCTSRQSAGV